VDEGVEGEVKKKKKKRRTVVMDEGADAPPAE
jgi:hypothetical protein